jgi:hypothetical protein
MEIHRVDYHCHVFPVDESPDVLVKDILSQLCKQADYG